MINKKLIHFNNFSNFNSKKLSANSGNTLYTLGTTGSITNGSPDISYLSIVFIKDTSLIWTHGTIYSCSKEEINQLANYTINGKKISTNPTLTKTDVGLSQADNTSDLNKPISTLTQLALDTKANISDLSNVLAEEVVNEPLLKEINTLTREEIKKDLFIDMWNEAVKGTGSYNATTKYFELEGRTNISYTEALQILIAKFLN